jgi:hypothetical protein
LHMQKKKKKIWVEQKATSPFVEGE